MITILVSTNIWGFNSRIHGLCAARSVAHPQPGRFGSRQDLEDSRERPGGGPHFSWARWASQQHRVHPNPRKPRLSDLLRRRNSTGCVDAATRGTRHLTAFSPTVGPRVNDPFPFHRLW